jgi:hypothetical protein
MKSYEKYTNEGSKTKQGTKEKQAEWKWTKRRELE